MKLAAISDCVKILAATYCPPSGSQARFPKSLPKREAAERYLWTDAFGVLNYLSLHHRMSSQGGERDMTYLTRAEQLVEAVESTLGTMRSDGKAERKMAPCDDTQSRPFRQFKGLRIGKVSPHEDAGMVSLSLSLLIHPSCPALLATVYV